MSAITALQSLISQRIEAYPLATSYLSLMIPRWKETTTQSVYERAQCDETFFWDTVELATRDILVLYSEYIDKSPGDPDLRKVLEHCLRLADDLPHDETFEDFEEVCESFYNQPIYPILEHSCYLGIHGLDRLTRVIGLLEKAENRNGRLLGQREGTFCDVAVGPAVIFTTVLQRLEGWQGIAFDISAHCVSYAKDMIDLHGISRERVRIEAADARLLPLNDGTLDLVIATEIIEHVPDPITLLKEIRRVLKVGGSLIASTPINLPWGPHLVVFSNVEEVTSLFEQASFNCQAFEVDPYSGGQSLTYGLFKKESC
jgi:2-polyprenyl-3-methyl-5-hydroxy-6-metoxy-1,4-benzoquinol methylase